MNMLKTRLKRATGILLTAAIIVSGVCACGKKGDEGNKNKTGSFVPSLDTKKETTLEIAGYMGNFEALDQVINDFNKYYPNVTITYEQNDANGLSDYLKNNDYVDIFMTNQDNVRSKDDKEKYAYEYCIDLNKKNLNTDAVEPKLLESCTVDGKLVRIPLSKNICGMVVNETLLKKEGIEIPKTYSEFMNACKILKEKGYTPIQSSKYHVCSDMILPMAMSMLGNDDELIKRVNSGDGSAAESFRPVYEKLEEIYKNGYTDQKVNNTYPDDNYDQSILTFFNGNVPFWICTTECVSGMKKRESKSEAFTKKPFEYKFVNVPMSEDGVYDYEEPWYGFSVNKKSDNIDYAIEFLQFLITDKELNTMAEVKGMPSAAVNSDDERYKDALSPEKTAGKYINDGKIKEEVNSAIADVSNEYGNGEIKSVDGAVKALKKRFEEIR